MSFLAPRPSATANMAMQTAALNQQQQGNPLSNAPAAPPQLRQPQGRRPPRRSTTASFLGTETVANRPGVRNTLVPNTGFGQNTMLGQA